MRMLLVEDDVMLADGLQDLFRQSGHGLDHVSTAESAITAVTLTAYDLLVVDLGLPRMDGITLVRTLRQQSHKMPILILSAREAVEDRVRCLNEGADDFLLKPFVAIELVARVQALLRRSQSIAQSRMSLGPLELDTALQEAFLHQSPLALTRREWHVLETLLLAAPKVVAKSRLVDALGRWDKEVSGNAIEIYVSRLRAKLQHSGVEIRTLRGVGYRLEWHESQDQANAQP